MKRDKTFLARQLDSEGALRRRLWLVFVAAPACLAVAVAVALVESVKDVCRETWDGLYEAFWRAVDEWEIVSDVWEGLRHTWAKPISKINE